MLDPAAARDKAASLVELARRKGADAADAVYVGERSQGVSVRLASWRTSIAAKARKSASASSSASATRPSRRRICRTRRSRRWSSVRWRWPPKRLKINIAGLAPEEMLFRGAPADLDLDDGGDPDPAELKERALAAEDAARASKASPIRAAAQALGLGIDFRHRHQPRLCRRDPGDRLQQLGQRGRRRGRDDAARLCLAFGAASRRS